MLPPLSKLSPFLSRKVFDGAPKSSEMVTVPFPALHHFPLARTKLNGKCQPVLEQFLEGCGEAGTFWKSLVLFWEAVPFPLMGPEKALGEELICDFREAAPKWAL